jgi:hypothetical protein
MVQRVLFRHFHPVSKHSRPQHARQLYKNAGASHRMRIPLLLYPYCFLLCRLLLPSEAGRSGETPRREHLYKCKREVSSECSAETPTQAHQFTRRIRVVYDLHRGVRTRIGDDRTSV